MWALVVISGHPGVIGELDLPLCSLLAYPLFSLGSWILVLFVPVKKSSSKPMQFCRFIFILASKFKVHMCKKDSEQFKNLHLNFF